MFDLPDIAVGAIIAALIASLFSFLGLVISKEQKTSEFRQAWIDSLRREISQFISAANSIHASTVKETADVKTEQFRPKSAVLASLDEAAAIIRLRLNPDETLSQRVLSEISKIDDILRKMPNIDYKELEARENSLISVASLLLKSEWDRVKRGECTYRIAKWSVLIAVIAFLALAGISFFGGSVADPHSGEVGHHVEDDAVKHPD